MNAYPVDALTIKTRTGAVRRNPEVLVAGLRWDPIDRKRSVDLDLCCVLLDTDLRLVDVVLPGRERNENSSLVHTGDCSNGAGTWDDERIFIFLDAVPRAVSRIGIMVVSASGEPLSEVPNAFCHLSDHDTDEALLNVDLCRVARGSVHWVAILMRKAGSWHAAAGIPPP